MGLEQFVDGSIGPGYNLLHFLLERKHQLAEHLCSHMWQLLPSNAVVLSDEAYGTWFLWVYFILAGIGCAPWDHPHLCDPLLISQQPVGA